MRLFRVSNRASARAGPETLIDRAELRVVRCRAPAQVGGKIVGIGPAKMNASTQQRLKGGRKAREIGVAGQRGQGDRIVSHWMYSPRDDDVPRLSGISRKWTRRHWRYVPTPEMP